MNNETTKTIVGENTKISGSLEGDEDLTIKGRVEGNIRLSKTLIVEPNGVVVADVDVKDAVVSGVLVGNIIASDSVHITEEGRMVGDIASPRVIIVAGASFRGKVDMGDLDAARPDGTPRPAARPKPVETRAPARPVAAPAKPMAAPSRGTPGRLQPPPRLAPPPRPEDPPHQPGTQSREQGESGDIDGDEPQRGRPQARPDVERDAGRVEHDQQDQRQAERDADGEQETDGEGAAH